MRLIILIFSIILSNNFLKADYFVADVMRYQILKNYSETKPKHYSTFNLGTITKDSVYQVTINTSNKVYKDISAYICPLNNPVNGCYGITKGVAPYNFNYTASVNGSYILKIDNSYSTFITKKVIANVVVNEVLDINKKQALIQSFKQASDDLFSTFDIPEFKISLKPCGQENAFSQRSNGNITMCSELFMKLIMENKIGAVNGIFYHELGHSLLGLLGLPNYNNEKTVDEFGVVMLYWDGIQEQARDWISYFQEADSYKQAQNLIKNGGAHPLSIQRARHIDQILRSPTDTIARWNKLLYPHLTNKKLLDIISRPGKYGNKKLAADTLASKN